MAKKIKVDTSLFKKINNEFNEKLATALMEVNMDTLEKLHYKVVNDYINYLNMPLKKQNIYYERIIGEIDLLITFGKTIHAFEETMTFKTLENKIRELAQKVLKSETK